MAPPPRPVPFGRVLTAMVTPFDADGGLDLDGAQRLAEHLVAHGNDGIVVSGTTGESATTSDDEKDRLVRAVVEAVGDRAHVLAGVGTSDTAHSCELARRAEKAGATGLLAVTPYYSRPPQEGLVRHFTAIADASGLPVMLYDIPVRTGLAIETPTLLRVAEHERVVAVKDAKGDLGATSLVMLATDLAYYSGDDVLNLPLLSVGGCGFVSVVAHVAGERLRALADAHAGGRPDEATRLHLELMPLYTGMFRTQGVILTKAALTLLGLPAGPLRPPLVDATPEQVQRLAADLVAGGVALP
ncbi:4-hydroxy-tetrahydrodipicolinate synthase [Vallicoccus soli]|uniref:4-hydroxy-tetrahydrodipicolinate synthase n=1 Tax=Vallicoccus soli TaxID=2339232 RepID=A0A3A3Z023_9ACTN|nr:4-hydroxy-tetrahydrodipicolinate synthase [Vallicoccus soli]RJK96483.1 4-hydroxy-tetrahydrodipicolinate synthase [Vallicoccus soli]